MSREQGVLEMGRGVSPQELSLKGIMHHHYISMGAYVGDRGEPISSPCETTHCRKGST